MIYIVDGTEKFIDSNDVAQYITDNLDTCYYDEMLNECYGDTIEICGLEYTPALAFESVDPIAYRCGMNDYYDSLSRDIAYDIERLGDGAFDVFYDFNVDVIDDDLIKEDIEELKETIKIMEDDGEDISEEKNELAELEERLKEVSL